MIRRPRFLLPLLAVILIAGLLAMVPGTPSVAAAPKDKSPRLVEQTETADIYANGDGTNTAVFYAGPVNFFDKTAKEWRKIDNQFRRRNDRIENGAGPVQVQLPSEVSASDGIRIGNEDWSVSFAFEEAKSKRPATIRNGRVRYDAVAPGMSLEYQMLSTGLKEDIVLDQPLPRDWPGYFRFRLSTSGVTPVAVDGDRAVSLQDAQGQELARIPRGMMVDASRAMGAVDMKLGTDQAGWFVDVVPDSDFLTSPARIYPLRIDPEIDITLAGPTDTSDATVGNLGGSCTSCNWNSYFLWAGKSNGGADEFYSFLRFADLTRILGKTVTWSQLRMFATYEDDPSNLGWTALLTKGTWNESTITWNTMASHGPERIDIDANLQVGPDYYADTHDWAQAWANGQHGEWINGKWSPYGITINTAGENAFFEFGSSESGDPNTVPALWVKYTNQTPNLPTGLSPADGWTGTSSPQLSATLNDPDDSNGWIEFDIDSAITAVVPTTNGTVSWNPALGIGLHSWRARGRDFDSAGPWTALRYFTINTGPSVPDELSPETNWIGQTPPTLSAHYFDPSGLSGSIEFEVSDGSGIHTFPATNSSPPITYTPTGLGSATYTWRARASNGYIYSEWSEWRSFTTNLAVAFNDMWTLSDNSMWSSSKWATTSNSGTKKVDVQGNRGELWVNGSSTRATAQMTDIADADVSLAYEFSDRSAGSELRIALRGSGATGASQLPNSYRLDIPAGSTTIKLRKLVGGTRTSLPSGSFTYDPDGVPGPDPGKHHIRFSVIGSTLRVMAWPDGSPQPEDWDLEVTDTSITGVGKLQLSHSYSSGAARSVYIDDLLLLNRGGSASVGTDYAPTVPSNGKKIYLSPAHHVPDNQGCAQAMTDQPYLESVGAREIAKEAALRLADRGYTVRVGSGFPEDNISDSNAFGADVHIPIHSNGGESNCAPPYDYQNGGTWTIYHANQPSGQDLADKLLIHFNNSSYTSPGTNDMACLDTSCTKFKEDGLGELRQPNATTKTYIEAAFHTFGPDADYLRDRSFNIGVSIANGLDSYFGFGGI